MSQSKETFQFKKEGKEEEFERKGVGIILIQNHGKADDVKIYVVEHKANPNKNIREGDIGTPCETPKPNETTDETINRLFMEEVGLDPTDIKLNAQKVQRLKVEFPQQRIQGDLLLLWITDLERFHEIKPQDTDEINRGFFLSLKQLLEDPNIQLRQDLNPRWFLEPLAQEGILKY